MKRLLSVAAMLSLALMALVPLVAAGADDPKLTAVKAYIAVENKHDVTAAMAFYAATAVVTAQDPASDFKPKTYKGMDQIKGWETSGNSGDQSGTIVLDENPVITASDVTIKWKFTDNKMLKSMGLDPAEGIAFISFDKTNKITMLTVQYSPTWVVKARKAMAAAPAATTTPAAATPTKAATPAATPTKAATPAATATPTKAATPAATATPTKAATPAATPAPKPTDYSKQLKALLDAENKHDTAAAVALYDDNAMITAQDPAKGFAPASVSGKAAITKWESTNMDASSSLEWDGAPAQMGQEVTVKFKFHNKDLKALGIDPATGKALIGFNKSGKIQSLVIAYDAAWIVTAKKAMMNLPATGDAINPLPVMLATGLGGLFLLGLGLRMRRSRRMAA